MLHLPLQGRGGSTGYDNAVALPARSDSDELAKENTKSTVALKGQAVFSVAKIDTETNEIAGELDLVLGQHWGTFGCTACGTEYVSGFLCSWHAI